MSIVGIYRSVPSPQSDFYRHPLASAPDSIALRNAIQGQAQESKMSLSSGPTIYAPPAAATPVKDSASSNGGHLQDESRNATATLPKPVESGQFTTQFHSSNAFERVAVQDEKVGVVSEQNRPAESWATQNSNIRSSQTTQTRRESDPHGEEHDEDLGDDLSNGEEGDGGQGRSVGDGGDNSKKSKRFRFVFPRMSER